MTELITEEYQRGVYQAAEILRNAERVLILSHSAPDGDTIGSAFALCRALKKLGRLARVECADELPAKYDYLISGLKTEQFDPDLIVTSDIASETLFGKQLEKYIPTVGLSIDHHPSNTRFAKFTLLDPKAAATCEIISDVLNILGVEYDCHIAECIYTGLATDTGCFRFPNTRPKTLRTAARMAEYGAETARINKLLFETVSRERLMAETLALQTLEFHFGEKAALMTVSLEMMEKSGASEVDLEGMPAMPARIEGVLAGITVKEKEAGVFKISVRTNGELNASEICARLGGGGHKGAAGCTVLGTAEKAKALILEAVKSELLK